MMKKKINSNDKDIIFIKVITIKKKNYFPCHKSYKAITKIYLSNSHPYKALNKIEVIPLLIGQSSQSLLRNQSPRRIKKKRAFKTNDKRNLTRSLLMRQTPYRI